MSSYDTPHGNGDRHTNDSLGQGAGWDEMADDELRASPTEPVTRLSDHLDLGTLQKLGVEDEQGQELTFGASKTTNPRNRCKRPAARTSKYATITDHPKDPREAKTGADWVDWSPAHDRALCEGVSALDPAAVDPSDDGVDAADCPAIEPRPYLTEQEERANARWAERHRLAARAIALERDHAEITGGADAPHIPWALPEELAEDEDDAGSVDPTERDPTEPGDRNGMAVTAIEDALACSTEDARRNYDALEASGEMVAAALDDIGRDASADDPDAVAEPATPAPPAGPGAAAAADTAATNGGVTVQAPAVDASNSGLAPRDGAEPGGDAAAGTVTGDDGARTAATDPVVGHRAGYTRSALAHPDRAPIRQATDAYWAPATTVGHVGRSNDAMAVLLTLVRSSSTRDTSASPLDQLDDDQRAAVRDEAARIHEQYPFFGADHAAVAIASQIARHGRDLLHAVVTVTDDLTAWTGVTPIGRLDPADPPERPYDEGQATIQGTITRLYEPAASNQQQVGYIDDGTGRAKLTVWEKSGIDTVLHEGDTVRVVDGLLGQYKGEPTLAAVGEQRYLPAGRRSHRGTIIRVLERGDGPAPIHGLHYQIDWTSGRGFPGEQRLDHGPATKPAPGSGSGGAQTRDPRAGMAQETLAAVNQAAHRLATQADLDADVGRPAISRTLAERVADDDDLTAAVMAILTQPALVEDAAVEPDPLPDPTLPRTTPADRRGEPVEHPDSATKFTLETAFDGGTWLYADEIYPAPDAWPILHRTRDWYGNVTDIEQVGTLTLPADTPTSVERTPERPVARSATDTAADAAIDTAGSSPSAGPDEPSLYTTSARCPRCNETVDANVRIMQTRAADEAGTRLYDGACGHTWRGDD